MHTAVFTPALPTLISEYTPPPFAVSAPQPATSLDLAYGGDRRVTGTVKKVPNTPLRRRVRLYDNHMTLVRETWSDAATGAFEFKDIRPGWQYTVVAYDHLNEYRALVIDRVEAV